MGVLDGQDVNAAVTNPAFINKNQDDTMGNILGFNRAGSGSSLLDIQAATNRLYTCTGASETQTGTVYSAPASTITDGQSHQTALSELAAKFSNSTGHTHDGSAGNGNPIATSSLSGTALLSFVTQGTAITGATGGSTDVSSLLSGITPSTGNTVAGAVVNTPYNRVMILYGDNSKYRDEVITTAGNLIYGRLTHSGSVWTLTYYSEIAGVETATNLPATSTLLWFYRQLQNPITSTSPNYNSIFELFSKTTKTVNTLFGDISLVGTNGTTITPSGQTLTFSSPSLSSTTPQPVGSSNVVGSGTTTARSDHAHEGVHSVAVSGNSGILGDVILQQAGNITLTQSGNTINIAATTAVTTIGAIDSQTKSSNGGVISVPTLYFQTADLSFPGLVSTGNQSFAGIKTFQSATTTTFVLNGSTSGTLTMSANAVTTSYALIWPAAQASGTQVLSNDGSGNLSWASAASSGVTTVGTIDSQSKSANGAVISTTNIYFQTADASFPGMMSTGTQTIAGAKTFSGGITATVTGTASGNTTITAVNHAVVISSSSNTLSTAATSATAGVALVSTGSSSDPAFGQLDLSSSSAVKNALAIANAGTNITTYTTGDILYASATNVLSKLPIGTSNQGLLVSGGIPAWSSQNLIQAFASYTITSSGWSTAGTYAANYKRIGDSGVFSGSIRLTTAPTGTFQFSQADFFGTLSLTLDTSKLPGQTDTQLKIGGWEGYKNGVANYSGGLYVDTATGQIVFQNGLTGTVTASSPTVWANTDSIGWYTDVLPITQWA